MEDEIKKRLDEAREKNITDPPKKKKGCSDCKKKKATITKLEPIIEEDVIYVPTIDEIKLAYAELTSFGGVKKDQKDFIKRVYHGLFNEEFDFDCGGCASTQARKFANHLRYNLKLIS
jgi:hypothetical protein